jgi:hypothetical protein
MRRMRICHRPFLLLLPNYQDSYQETTMKPGYGEGVFVVIKAQRPDIADRPG